MVRAYVIQQLLRNQSCHDKGSNIGGLMKPRADS